MPKLRRPSYATKIANLRLAHLELPCESMAPLLSALGCALLNCESRVDAVGEITNWSVTRPKRTSRVYEILILDTLTLALNVYAEEDDFIHDDNAEIDLALLYGLSKNRRYRSCLQTSIGPYNLALLLSHITERNLLGVDSHGERYNYLPVVHAANAEAFCRLANDWLKPAEPFLTTPDTEALMRSLFGDAICDLMTVDGVLTMLRSGTRLPFMPGLLPAYLETAPVALPTMETL